MMYAYPCNRYMKARLTMTTTVCERRTKHVQFISVVLHADYISFKNSPIITYMYTTY